MKKFLLILTTVLIACLFGCSNNDDFNYENTSWRTENSVLTIDGGINYTFATPDTIIFGICRYNWHNLYLYQGDSLVAYYRTYDDNKDKGQSIYQVDYKENSSYPFEFVRSNYTQLSFQ